MEANKTRVLLIYVEMIPSILLAGHSQLTQIERLGKIEYRTSKEANVTDEELIWADVVVYGRLDDWYAFELAKRIKSAGKKLIYMIDDDLLNVAPDLSSAAYYRNPGIQKYILGMLNLSDAVMSPSRMLLEKYAEKERRGIFVEEPALYPIDEIQGRVADESIRIGFAGSIDRVKDVEEILSGALTRIKQEYGSKVSFAFFGAIPSFAKTLDAEVLPYCDSYEEYRRALNESRWDIGLAPMPKSKFHECKHYIKYIEYAAAGIVGVFSDEMPYIQLRNLVPDVLLCENSEEDWYQTIKLLIDDKERLLKLRKIALQQAHNTFSVAGIAERLLSTAPQVFEYHAPKCNEKRIAAGIRSQRYIRQILTKIKVYGWKTPFMIARKILKLCYRVVEKGSSMLYRKVLK